MHFSALFHTLSFVTALVAAAPAQNRRDGFVVEERDQILVAPNNIVITAPVSNARAIKLVSPDTVTYHNPKAATFTESSSPRVPLSTSTTTDFETSTRITGTVTRSSTVATNISTLQKTISAVTTTTVPISTSSTVIATSSSKAIPSLSKSSNMPVASTTSTASSSPSAPVSSSTYTPVNAAYYPDWTGDQIPPESVDYSLFDILYFSFVIPASDFSLYFTQDNSIDLLQRLIKNGHAAGTKICITVGGWTGSQYFSDAVATAATRATFAQNIVDMINLYGADGIDIDWEYPGQGGADGNDVSSADSTNLLAFLKLLRSQLGKDKVISLATPLNVWYGSNGAPLTDVSQHAKYIDHILLMNYDVWGASSTPGPNAPLNICADSNSDQPESNAVNAVASWMSAGMPASKIMLGIASYGYVSDSTATTLIHKRKRNTMLEAENARKLAARTRLNLRGGDMMPKFSARSRQFVARNVLENMSTTSSASFTSVTGTSTSSAEKVAQTSSTVKIVNSSGDLSDFTGSEIEFNQLLQYKALALSSTGAWYGKNGYTRKWDTCSSTPYLYNVAKSTVVTYDDPTSLKIKGAFAVSMQLKGVGMWDISGDTSDWLLTKGVRTGLGTY